MLYTKFLPNISSDSGGKVDFGGLAIFQQQRPYLIPEQPEFHFSEALQPCHDACEI